MKAKSILSTLLSLSISTQFAWAQDKRAAQNDREKQIVALFDVIKKKPKGALDVNTYQTPIGRVIVSPKDPATGKTYVLNGPPGTQLTVAFRNADADKLAALGFYVGNRYGSNYFELRNQLLESPQTAQQMKSLLTIAPETYNYTGPSVVMNANDKAQFAAAAQNFKLRHDELKTRPEGSALAKSLAQHQMIELYYILNSPDSKLATSYKQRGVSDDRHELQYYRLFSDYLASQATTDLDYLLQYEFQSRSELAPGKKSVSLSAVRVHVALIYDRLAAEVEKGAYPKLASEQFRALRNTVHNSLKSYVIGQLENYLAANKAALDAIPYTQLVDGKEVTSKTSDEIAVLISHLKAYYQLDTEVFSVLAKSISADLPEIKDLLASFKQLSEAQLNINLDVLGKLSKMAVKARQQFLVSKNIDLVHFVYRASQVIQQELGKIPAGDLSLEVAKLKILVDLNYATGLFDQSQHETAMQMIQTQLGDALGFLREQLSACITKYNQTFQPALFDWQLVSTSVFKFVEDGLRSTSLIQLDSQIQEIMKNQAVAPSQPSPGQNGSQGSTASSGEYAIETLGLGYGYLRFIPKAQTETLTKQMTYKDIPIFESMPLDLGVVAGTITEQPQTPLSHVNMKSKDRKTPNMYLKDASKRPEVAKLINKLVKFELTKNQYTISEVSLAEAEAYWTKLKSSVKKFKLRADLNEKRIRATSEMGFNDVVSVGAKAANYAEGTKILPGVFRDAFAIPFYYYEEFMTSNTMEDGSKETIAQHITKFLADPKIRSDRNLLIKKLQQIQDRITSDKVRVNPFLVSEIKKLVSTKYPGEKMRFRSSTNSEDMPNFTGAGLYTSEGYNPKHDDPNYKDKNGQAPAKRKTIENALKTVWASVWNLRAWDEREHYGIEHGEVKMAIALTPGYSELANGVGVSKNSIEPELGAGVYLNIQSDEDAVTNPDPAITPDQVLVLFKPDPKTGTKYTLKYYRYSSKTKTKPVLDYAEVEKIADYLRVLHNHFYKLYHPKNDNPQFALDVEFKVDDIGQNGKKDGVRKVFYKQARPFGG